MTTKRVAPLAPVAIKLGSQPAIVEFDRRCRFEVGLVVRYRIEGHRNEWKKCRVLSLDPIKVEKL